MYKIRFLVYISENFFPAKRDQLGSSKINASNEDNVPTSMQGRSIKNMLANMPAKKKSKVSSSASATNNKEEDGLKEDAILGESLSVSYFTMDAFFIRAGQRFKTELKFSIQFIFFSANSLVNSSSVHLTKTELELPLNSSLNFFELSSKSIQREWSAPLWKRGGIGLFPCHDTQNSVVPSLF